MPYFTHHESREERRARPDVDVRNYHAAVKGGLLAACPPASLLDLGAGRGADVGRYRRFGRVVAIDTDPDALAELTRRARAAGVPVETHVADMCAPLPSAGPFTAVSAMFCVHYAMAAREALARGVAAALAPGGMFVGIALDGASVLAALGPARRRQFTGWACLALAADDSRALDVTITSISHQPRREWLVPWPELLACLTDAGLQLVRTGLLDPGERVRDPALRAFSMLHRHWAFRKVRPG